LTLKAPSSFLRQQAIEPSTVTEQSPNRVQIAHGLDLVVGRNFPLEEKEEEGTVVVFFSSMNNSLKAVFTRPFLVNAFSLRRLF
jgi:hypothetical protein